MLDSHIFGYGHGVHVWDGMVFCDIVSFVLFFCFFSCVYAYADVL